MEDVVTYLRNLTTLCMKETRIENIVPILSVKDISGSRRFYIDLLGFEEARWGNDEFTRVGRNNCYIYLSRNGQGTVPAWVWLGVDGDIFAMHEVLKEKGANILLPPTNYPWALEMQVSDPDGHVLRFGSEPDQLRPFAEMRHNGK